MQLTTRQAQAADGQQTAPPRISRAYRLRRSLSDLARLPRLQGRACIICGRTGRHLYPAGTVTTVATDGKQTWRVRVCETHQEAA